MMGVASARKKIITEALPASAAFLVIGIAFWHIKFILAPPHEVNLGTVDLYQQFLPWHKYAAASLHDFSLPLWFPNTGAGMPFIATLSTAVFYPPNFLYLILPAPLAMGIISQFHFILAGLTMYGFCRVHNLRPSVSVLGGIGYLMSNAVWDNYINPHYLAGLAWMPAVFLFAERVNLKPTLRNSLALSVLLSIQFLSGAGQFFIYSIYFVAFYVALRLVFDKRTSGQARQKAKVAMSFALSVVVAMLVCGVQLLPTLELLRHSVRASALPEESVHFLGFRVPWWQAFLAPLDSPKTELFENLYHQGGFLQVLFVLVALMRLRERKIAIAAILCAISMLLSAGYATPLYGYFALLPGVGLSRQPNRLGAVTAFALAFLAAVGLDALSQEDESDQKKQIMLLLKILACGAILGVALWLLHTKGRLLYLAASVPAIVLVIVKPKTWLARVAVLAIIGLSAWEMSDRVSILSSHPQAMPDYLSPADRQMLEQLPELVGMERIFIEERGVPPRPFSSIRAASAGLNVVGNYHPAIFARTDEVIRKITGRKSAYPDGRIELTSEAPRPDILNLLSVKYLLVHSNKNIFETADPGSPMARFANNLRVARVFLNYVLYENLTARPRASFSGAALVATDEYDSLRALTFESFGDRGVVIEAEDAGEIPPLEDLSSASDKVTIGSYSPHRVSLNVFAERGGILLLTDSYYPGWTAFLDAERTRVYCANYLFRGVYVPPGNHTVEFLYRPRTFYAGVALSVLGISLLLVGLQAAQPGTVFWPVTASEEPLIHKI